MQNTSRDFRNRFFLISQKLLALSIRCSEMYGIINNIFRKNTQKSNLFERNQYLLSSFSSTQERRFFFQGEHDFGPETMEENNKSRSLHKMKFNIHLYTKKHNNGSHLSNKKQKNPWMICLLFFSCWLPHPIISWPGTALPDSRHLPGHDAPAPRRN